MLLYTDFACNAHRHGITDRNEAFKRLEAAEARCAELERDLAAADATCERVLMDDGGNLVPEAFLRAAESRCAELEGSCDAWTDRGLAAEARCAELAAECDLLLSDAVLVSTQNRLAEAEELLREINAANFDARNLTVDDYEWRVSAFLAEGDT